MSQLIFILFAQHVVRVVDVIVDIDDVSAIDIKDVVGRSIYLAFIFVEIYVIFFIFVEVALDSLFVKWIDELIEGVAEGFA